MWLNIMKDECYVFMARNKEAHVNKTDWYIDFGASRHFTNKKIGVLILNK
jgi:hypothetical protein